MSSELNNPAGRLHALLGDFAKAAADGRSIREAWAEVLDVETDEVAVHLARAVGIVTDLERSVEHYADPGQQKVYQQWVEKWVAPFFFPTGEHWDKKPGPKHKAVDDTALTVLGGMSSYLSVVHPEAPRIPGKETLAQLRQQTREAIDVVEQDDELEHSVRKALAERLHDLDEALTYLRFGGPEDVAEALKLLRCQYVAETEERRQSPTYRSIEAVALRAWAAFSVGGPAAQAGLEAWMGFGRMLGG